MAFKLQYKPHIMMTMKADTITRIRVDYTIHLSQSQFFDKRFFSVDFHYVRTKDIDP